MQTNSFVTVKQIDNQLNIIREKGRQAFLENSPDNFTRILHDYSDNKKGFVVWKSAIEEFIWPITKM